MPSIFHRPSDTCMKQLRKIVGKRDNRSAWNWLHSVRHILLRRPMSPICASRCRWSMCKPGALGTQCDIFSVPECLATTSHCALAEKEVALASLHVPLISMPMGRPLILLHVRIATACHHEPVHTFIDVKNYRYDTSVIFDCNRITRWY